MTYDILDAGPRKRFTVNGRLVHNCTGEGPQPTNSPKAGPDLVRCGCKRHYQPLLLACPWCGVPRAPTARVVEWSPDAAEDAIEVLRQRSLPTLEHVFGDAMHAIAGCIRGLYDAAPGHDLISTDYNSIEAVGLAMLSGEQWRIDVFRTHGKIYEASASTMFKVPFEEFEAHKKATGQHHHLRQKGKISELAFGYGGWIGSAHAFGMPGTDDEVKKDILAWRDASPAVVWLWGGQFLGQASSIRDDGFADRWDRTPHYFGVEGMAISAILDPGTEYVVKRLDGSDSGLAFLMRGKALYMRLPSGRWLTYHDAQVEQGERGLSISYWGNNTNPKNGPIGWINIRTWGSRIVENANQGACRDILRFACINLEQRGYPVVLHVYDEIVCEIPEGFGSLEEFEAIVTVPPFWARDWPIRAPGGWRAKRYRKG